ncbi:sulfatase [Flavilitoribacter nigricans]|uniref:Sulfatase n=1 Tax=Flavilitoribacter nigricans (strain ATCC 23147 / DSM 23189 / NBRC 102662 / NCIMB 1420 / SS-2) TaxID=1122177 RepID=A0A2D0NBP3_FLAN2|nr:sulfatase [Flavilitoribacter nigricans]PHN05931.1 sulfatase [Flavilitoribacter nigricans DSM 23189 = NBRC 102662]
MLFKRIFYLLAIVLLAAACRSNGTQSKGTAMPEHPNVLFIAIDDLRPELGAYGNEVVQSPHLDQLASSGFLFNHHYVTVPTCGASRYSLITGMHPLTRSHIQNSAIAEYLSEKPETERPESFVHHLRRNGYHTTGIGKIAHSADGLVYGYLEEPSDIQEMPHSWNEFLFDAGEWGNGWNAFFGYAGGRDRNHLDKQVKPYEAAPVEDEGYPDGLTANLAIEQLQKLKKQDQPFFLGVGFFKPHLPFNAPKKYWDLYDESEIPVSPSPGIPENVNEASLHGSGEFNQYQLGEEKAGLDHDVSDAYARKLKHGYYAAISYIDAQVGKLMAELKKLDLDKNTIVVVWGDHGWHLGDQRVWGKHTIFERAVRSAFILKLPGNQYAPKAFDEIVSTVDIYPTLVDLCGLEMPHQTDGHSLKMLWEPQAGQSWRNTAYSYFRNGISVRTDRYRLTRYFREAEPTVELYDHQSDPYETKNVAADQAATVDRLLETWNAGNTGIFDR